MTAEISVILPVRNAEYFLDDCINSIIEQTYIFWELIAVNNQSTDHSLKILKDWAKKDSRIQIFTNNNSPIIPEALSMAYKNASGKYITRMDADDIMPKYRLQKMINALESSVIESVVTGKVKYFSDNILGNGYLRYENWLNRLIDQKSHYLEIYKECVLPSPCWMASKNTLDKIGAFKSNAIPEDYDLSFLFYKHKIPIIGLKNIMHFWREYNTRNSRTDKNYADTNYFSIKTKYFIEIDRDKEKTLIIWGAGNKAKEIALILIGKNQTFTWICNNEKKIGLNIYGKIIKGENTIQTIKNLQIIIAVSSPRDQEKIKKNLESKNISKEDIFFFC